MEDLPKDSAPSVGAPLPDWSPPPLPRSETIVGRYCRMEPVDVDAHAQSLFASFETCAQNWTYLAYGPFKTLENFRIWMKQTCLGTDPQFFTIIPESDGKPAGLASYLRIKPNSGNRGNILDDATGFQARIPALRMEMLGRHYSDS